MVAPLYVVANGAEATAVLRRLSRDGWVIRSGFAMVEAGWDVSGLSVVRYGRVTDADTASLAVLAAARGAGVVCVCDPVSSRGRALSADLGRIGPLGVDPAVETGVTVVASPLTDEQSSLLARLAAGETIAAAAEAEFLSLRTANRRIAAARKALGVATTREAVMAFMRLRSE